MRKIFVIIFTVFLASCSKSNINPSHIYFTLGGPSSAVQNVKFSNYQDYTSALANGLFLRDYSNDFDEEFFDKNDLIVIQFGASEYLTCNDFKLNYINNNGEKIIVSITNLYNKNPHDPEIQSISVYSFLYVIKKTNVEEVELLLD